MKVTSVEAFELPLAKPLVSAETTIDHRRGLLVRYGDGIGEATPLPPWTEPYDRTESALQEILSRSGTNSISRALKKLDDEPAARHGLTQAVLDHHARQAGKPLYRYLGGKGTIRSIPVHATLDAESPDEVANSGAKAIEQGFETVKLKVGGRAIDADIERVRQLRDQCGTDISIRLDANASWSNETAQAAFEHFRPHGIEFIEQPVSGIDPTLIEALQHRGILVALDEAVTSESTVDVITSGAGVMVLKPMTLGGPDRARALARTARICGITPVFSNLLTGAVGRIGTAHVQASLSSQVPAGLATGDRFETDLQTTTCVRGGGFILSETPGLGLHEVSLPHA